MADGRSGAKDQAKGTVKDPAGRHQAERPHADRDLQWWRDSVIYQLHPKSFMDGNDDGIGDFAGLIARLDHVAGLGADAIWLLPFYPSPRRDDGYDIAEYTDVHADYGKLADFRRLVREAHNRGLKVITELVINHTSDEHPWFQRARHAPPGSWQRDFYVWSDDPNRYDGTRIIFIDTEKSNWAWDPVAKSHYWHRFYSHQPDLNFDNPRVLEAILRVMRFWLDMGVDGLRLDAVPYLVERDGTNNENLPETHAILKRIRAALEDRYPNRMLLAEANQWPEDVQEYFGDGDECHMCFHFPLMPRMYMSVAQEDRFPITDILRQTPEIPEGCQWAVFLRNHDELTLEMVTDSERDTLWSIYAADRRARINLGIRRRLSPLMENDRRRIELMNGLLLSMPGTPVIYYGDEIGMGDNVFLRDRDGVRTPMQWSPDRNGGFSRADPAALVLPTIQDPMYGYQTLNVETQARDSHSLLNWTRRMLAVRRRSRAFGRGTMRLLYPGNRKVLAYLREHEGDVVLCVFNLSRAAQAVELDLSSLHGRVPVEMLGGTPFPPVGSGAYPLTLPPYAFMWFLLAEHAQLPPWHSPAPDPLPELRTLVAPADMKAGGAQTLLDEARRVLEREVLPEWLRRRRWFGQKDQASAGHPRFAYAVPFHTNPLMILAEIETPDGTRWSLPLARVPVEEEGLPAGQLAMARLRQGPRVGLLTDGMAVDGFVRAMLAACRKGSTMDTPQGKLHFTATETLREMALPELPDVRRLGVEQSNSTVIIGEAVVLKLFRRVLPGRHPEAEMARHLTNSCYPGTPALLGEVVRVGADGVPHTLMVLQAFCRNQGDAWGWTLDWLARTVDDAALTEAEPEDPLAGYLPLAEAIGRRLAQLHLALARPSDDPDFTPETADAAMVDEWVAQTETMLARALEQIARPGLVGESALLATWLLRHKDALLAALRANKPDPARMAATRIHGDFHLGQVLVAPGDAVILDFEGEPARTLDARRAKYSPLRDVAGLLRSMDYAAAVAAATEESATATAAPTLRRAALIARWREAAEAAFLAAYNTSWEAEAGPVPPGATQALDLFLVEKAAYEVGYEIANRPAWLPVPLRGLVTIAARLLGETAPLSE
ncbi:maltose alpha-D-glucosyltransferase [Falsiroseomonas sp.]|uniref:maltose alpha-D-glucosyltransferase n=1 Tax=Falsiroseomonas sp. TaxID=2870721 RepID=UPI00271BC654|nr:maltose alpha-D-glucosyltransferase [Falsiroseomonas sp.]MDO9501191.1 maltose alpha-D-glucosyltransferase [Falsiroseomonas sp.]